MFFFWKYTQHAPKQPFQAVLHLLADVWDYWSYSVAVSECNMAYVS